MLHLLWGRCGLMLAERDVVDGAAQGAVVPLPVKFLSGPNRGVFNKADGNLYIAGSTGWQTSAIKHGCFQRVRYTGKPVNLPLRWRTRANGLEITFSEPLDKTTASGYADAMDAIDTLDRQSISFTVVNTTTTVARVTAIVKG